MMRILAAGDFHNRTPKYLKALIRKYKPDVLVSPGDFCLGAYFEEPKNPDKFLKKAFKKGKETLTYLNALGIPVYLVFGNHDFWGKGKKFHKKYGNFRNIVKKLKNITFVHKRKIKFGDYTLIGYSGYRDAELKADLLKKLQPELFGIIAKMEKKSIKHYREMFKKHLEKLLKGRKNVILLTHEPPYNTRLDKIRNKMSPLNGVHIGDDTFLWAIKRFRPVLHICGHMHENQGKAKVGKTIVVNTGLGENRKAAIIDLKDKKIKVKLIR